MLGLQWNLGQKMDISAEEATSFRSATYPLINPMSGVLSDNVVPLGLHDRLDLVSDIPKTPEHISHLPQQLPSQTKAHLYSAPGLQIAIASSSDCFVVLIKSREASSTFPTG